MATTRESPAYLSLAQASCLIPPTKGDKPVHTSTITRWITDGVRSGDGVLVRLKATRFPGGWKVTRDDIDAFVDELTSSALDRPKGGGASPGLNPRRKEELALAARECNELGL